VVVADWRLVPSVRNTGPRGAGDARAAAAAARLTRDERIAELDRRRWTLRQIAVEVHLSHVAVRKILARQVAIRKAGRAAREQEILQQMEALRIGLAMRQARMNVLKRELIGLMEEDESAGIDELLGL
jgi:hypothetical protein